MDPATQANYTDIVTRHVSFDWAVDFNTKVISGSASHTLDVLKDDVGEVILDTNDLVIHAVELRANRYLVKPKHAVMGSALHIPLASGLKSGSKVHIKVDYKTTQGSTALQWLAKEQTQGKAFPYLFSQCQPIYARALAPLQDTSSVKITYSANVASTLPVLLSAIRASPPSDGPAHDGKVIGKDVVTYRYNQPIPIPSYLIAIACGNVVYRPFPKIEGKDWTTGVWAEPELIEASYWEFSEDTARFLAAEEKIVTSYKFGVYDLLVLPHHSHMVEWYLSENACLTFLTPTLLAGDRTLVDVVVHELTHSFFGNGVTHANASHFWLNEGWTTYMERLMLQVLHSPADRGFSYIIGAKSLKDALKEYEDQPKYQQLTIEFEVGEDPDNAFSTVPYEKGSNLILHLERTLGGLDVFIPYIKDYVNTYIGKSITTDEWKAHLYDYFKKHHGQDKVDALNTIDWNAWFYGRGLELPVKMEYDTSLAEKSYALAARWDASRSQPIPELDFDRSDISDLNTNQIIVFLERLESYPPLPVSHLTHLAAIYDVSSTPNAEIRLRFYQVALADSSSETARLFAEEAVKWVIGEDGTGIIKGRMKFCRPIFKAVFRVDKSLAVDAFLRAKDSFHPIAKKLLEKDLELA
ncbi:peptidase family M1-domain-containing protein [Infundibulicybe gibba]|nr:peptidase family M1-domain-containing protein [Infundibulicybe gibba]